MPEARLRFELLALLIGAEVSGHGVGANLRPSPPIPSPREPSGRGESTTPSRVRQPVLGLITRARGAPRLRRIKILYSYPGNRFSRKCCAALPWARTVLRSGWSAHAPIAAWTSLLLVASFLVPNMIKHPTSQPTKGPMVVPSPKWAATCNQVLPSDPKLYSGAL